MEGSISHCWCGRRCRQSITNCGSPSLLQLFLAVLHVVCQSQSSFFRWRIPVIHLGPWHHFVIELCSESEQNLRFHVFIAYKCNNDVLHNNWRNHLFTHHDHYRQNAGRHTVISYNGYRCPYQTTSKVILFYTGISALGKNCVVNIWTTFIDELSTVVLFRNYLWYVLSSQCWVRSPAIPVWFLWQLCLIGCEQL
jgi:hypothetical protein